MPLFVEAADKRMSQMRLKKMSQMRLKKMSQMRLKKMSQMRLKKSGGADEVVEEMYEDPDKRMSQLRLKKDVVWDPRWVKWGPKPKLCPELHLLDRCTYKYFEVHIYP